MKRLIALFLSVLLVLIPCAVFSDEQDQELQVKNFLRKYFDLRYRILSSLTYDERIESFLSRDMVESQEAISEADVLDAIVKYRKAQINDLTFDRFTYELKYHSISFSGNQATVVLDEIYDVYFKCAPTVKNSAVVEHIMVLEKTDGRWLILKDDYQDTEGVKKLLYKYLLENDITAEQAKEMLVAQSQDQIGGRLDMLETIVKNADDGSLMVFCSGKPIAYANGKAQKIDNNTGVYPFYVDGRIMIPLGFVCANVGAEASWEGKTRTAVVFYEGKKARIRAGEKKILVDDVVVNTDVPTQLQHQRIYIPAEAVAQLFNKKIYIDRSGLVIFSDTGFSENIRELSNDITEFYDALFTKADFPRIDGSTATYPLSMEIGKELLGLDETGVKGFITHNTTHNAYVNLIEGRADIIFVTPPSPEEYALAEERGIELEVIPVCKEGFVFLVNSENPVDSLTVKQVQDIYQGKITNWKEVGGEDSEIIPYQREPNSGSQTLMETLVMKGLKLAEPPKEIMIYGMGELIDRVADYSNAKNALGYSVYYYATSMYAKRNVKLLAINGVIPDKQTIKDGTYPFTSAYYAVLRKDEPENSSARRLLKWLLGKEGQDIAEKAGFVSL